MPEIFRKKADGSFSLEALDCPYPPLCAREALDRLGRGAVLEVVFDGTDSAEAIEAICRAAGHRIIESRLDRGTYRWTIKKAA